MHSQPAARATWRNRWTFILAASGSAVGLGNIWKFPYITGEYGGGAFVLVYLACIALIGLPLLMAEILLGRRGNDSPTRALDHLCQESGISRRWRGAGTLGVLAAFLILCFYSVVGGWALSYLWQALTIGFTTDAAEVGQRFGELLGSPEALIGWHSAFALLVIGVVSRGITQGIERTVSVLMPAMFVLLILLVLYASTRPGFPQAIEFLFAADFSKLTTHGLLTALGHAFFTLSLGMSVMLAYGSHLPGNVNIRNASLVIVGVDTAVALMAGLAIFAIVFSNDMAAAAGPGLVFKTVPLALAKLPLGTLLTVAFFALLLFAAWSSAISLLEPVVERLESQTRLTRAQASWLAGGVSWGIGVLCALSFNVLGEITLAGLNLFDQLDYLTTNILLPLTGLLIALLCGWALKPTYLQQELAIGDREFALWHGVIRWITPVLVLIVFAYNLVGAS